MANLYRAMWTITPGSLNINDFVDFEAASDSAAITQANTIFNAEDNPTNKTLYKIGIDVPLT